MNNNIPKSFEIPFFDHGKSLISTIRNSSRRRSQNIFYFIFKKIKNIFLYRVTFFCPINSLRVLMHKWRGIHIGKGVYIAQQVVLDNAYPEYIYIGDYVGINQGSTILVHTNIRSHFRGLISPSVQPVKIYEYALVGINSTILPGVIIGKYAVISAGSVVNRNVSDFTLVQGNPAKKVIKFEHLLTNKI